MISWARFGQRIGPGAGVFLSRHPPHHAETADEVNARHLQPVIGEVGVLLPIPGVLVARKIQVASLLRRHFRGSAHQGDSGSPQGSPDESGCVISRLARGSWCRFWVCMAMLLMKRTGRPRPSAAYGIMEPNGKPAHFRECVERAPMRAMETSVRARSASEGSGTSGGTGPVPVPAPGPACWRVDTPLW